MINPLLDKYAKLLLEYCVSIRPGDRLLIRSGFLAEPLLQSLVEQALQAGAIPELMVELDNQDLMWTSQGHREDQLDYIPMQYQKGMEEFDAYIFIKAPGNTRQDIAADPVARQRRQAAWLPYQQLYFERTASLSLKRNFCVYPTPAGAQEAGMHTAMYEQFVFDACMLYAEDPIQEWLNVKAKQQHLVDYLNQKKEIRYLSSGMDIRFSTEGRTWINSHGTTNMPSGEIYTSPVEDKVDGWISFDYPLLHQGREMEGITLKVAKGEIISWEARRGQDVLDEIMKVPGARRFGEAAIGTNQRIQRFTRNILFDEKIGGTIHMAIGQSYLQAGGLNKSSLHLDMIADMTRDGQIFADGELIYEKGRFLIS
jgi:aminopeptidase